MPTGISGLYKNTKGAKIARGEKIKQTHFDRIKAMSVEEMAEYFALDKHPSTPCYVCEYDNGLFCSKEDCNPDYKIKVFKEYLESEVQEDE